MGFPGSSVVMNLHANAGDVDLPSPELGRSSGEGNGNPLQYSCLENPLDRGFKHDLATERTAIICFQFSLKYELYINIFIHFLDVAIN